MIQTKEGSFGKFDMFLDISDNATFCDHCHSEFRHRQVRITFTNSVGAEYAPTVNDSATVRSLRQAIASRVKCDPRSFTLYLHTYRLHDAWPVASLDLSADSVIYIRETPNRASSCKLLADEDPVHRILSVFPGMREADARRMLQQAKGNVDAATGAILQARSKPKPPPDDPVPLPPGVSEAQVAFVIGACASSRNVAIAALLQSGSDPTQAIGVIFDGKVTEANASTIRASKSAARGGGDAASRLAKDFPWDLEIIRSVLDACGGNEQNARQRLVAMS
jgi:hypothetical protein